MPSLTFGAPTSPSSADSATAPTATSGLFGKFGSIGDAITSFIDSTAGRTGLRIGTTAGLATLASKWYGANHEIGTDIFSPFPLACMAATAVVPWALKTATRSLFGSETPTVSEVQRGRETEAMARREEEHMRVMSYLESQRSGLASGLGSDSGVDMKEGMTDDEWRQAQQQRTILEARAKLKEAEKMDELMGNVKDMIPAAVMTGATMAASSWLGPRLAKWGIEESGKDVSAPMRFVVDGEVKSALSSGLTYVGNKVLDVFGWPRLGLPSSGKPDTVMDDDDMAGVHRAVSDATGAMSAMPWAGYKDLTPSSEAVRDHSWTQSPVPSLFDDSISLTPSVRGIVKREPHTASPKLWQNGYNQDGSAIAFGTPKMLHASPRTSGTCSSAYSRSHAGFPGSFLSDGGSQQMVC